MTTAAETDRVRSLLDDVPVTCDWRTGTCQRPATWLVTVLIMRRTRFTHAFCNRHRHASRIASTGHPIEIIDEQPVRR